MDDSDDHGIIDYDGFQQAWFQLADLHTDGIGAARYAKWIRELPSLQPFPSPSIHTHPSTPLCSRSVFLPLPGSPS